MRLPFAAFEGLLDDRANDEPPPFLGSWERVYAAVVTYLFVLILVLLFATYKLNG